MTANLKPLVVVMVLSLLLFALAKPLALRFCDKAVYDRRRNVWLALTFVAFISPSFWYYTLLAMPLFYWCGKRDPNPVALFLVMLHVIPPVNIYIPTPVIKYLFELNNFRILALVVLLPMVIQMYNRPGGVNWSRYKYFDSFVLAFAAIQILLFLPYEAFTSSMRRGFLMVLDCGLIYIVFSRMGGDLRRLTDALAAFVLGCALMGIIALFESSRDWLMYPGIAQAWGDANEFAWLLRGDELRAQAASGHALALGYLLAMSIGFWLYLKNYIRSPAKSYAAFFLLAAALYITISRAPWLIAIIIYLVYQLTTASKENKNLSRSLLFCFLVSAFLVTPWGQPILDKLPFIGTVGAESVEYRQELWNTSMLLIQQNPWFGSPFVMGKMESLRQGQGIIDLVNVFAAMALFYGVVGLTLFLAPFLIGLIGAFLRTRQLLKLDKRQAWMGAALVATMVGTAFMLGAGSFGTSLPIMYWMLTGLAAELTTRQLPQAAAVPGAVRASATAGVRPVRKSTA